MKRLFLILPLLFLAHTAYAYQVSGFSTAAQLQTTGASTGLFSGGTQVALINSTVADDTVPGSPINGTLKNYCFTLGAGPGVGNTRGFYVMNGTATTSLQFMISGTNTSGCDNTDSVTFSKGDKIWWKEEVDVGPATISGDVAGGITIVPQNPGDIVFFNSSGIAGSAQFFNSYSTSRTSIATTTPFEGVETNVFPEAGTLDTLYFGCRQAPGAGRAFTGMVRQNTASSTLTTSCSGASQTNNADLIDSLSMSKGDLLGFEVVPTGATGNTALSWANRYHSNENTTSLYMTNIEQLSTDQTAATREIALMGVRIPIGPGGSFLKGEMTSSQTFTSIYASTTAPGGVATRTFALRVNGFDTSLQCTLTGSQNICSANSLVNVYPGDLVDYDDVPSGSPAVGSPQISSTATVLPTFQITTLLQIRNGLLKIISR